MGVKYIERPNRIKNIMLNINERKKTRLLTVGYYPADKYPDGEHVAQIAANNEYGVPERNIPSRPFFKRAINNMKKEYPNLFKEVTKTVGKHGVNTASLELIGNTFRDKIKQSINGEFGSFVPNAPATLMKKSKKGKKPLTDTNVMFQSTTFKVDDNL